MFSTIVNTLPAAATFNAAGTGRYVESTTVFGGPQNYYLLSPVRAVKGSSYGRKTFTDTRYVEVDVTVAGVVSRRSARVSVQIDIDPGVDVAVVDTLLIQQNETITTTYINRRLNGEI